ncbi:MAG: DUF3857 domain-containing protein [Burkholderiaceae bacterium]|nr:DUF3857 domain-containing protein [Burkholderiaceae bacterium]
MNFAAIALLPVYRAARIAIVLTLLGLLGSQSVVCGAAGIGDAPGAPGMREVASAEKSLSRGAPVPAWVDTSLAAPAAAAPGPLVVRLSDFQAYVDKEPVYYMRRMEQVNEASMLSNAGRIEIAFQPEYQQVALHALHIVRGGTVIDKTQVAQIRFLQREQQLNDDVLTGVITASVVLDDIRVGDTLDISYSITGQNPVFGGKFSLSAMWDNMVPTQRKRVILNAPEERAIDYRIIGNGAGIQVREQKSGGRKITRFYAENLAAVDYEPYAPPDVEQFRYIQLSEFKSWQQVAQWATALFDINAPSNAVDEVTASMLNAGDADATVQSALSYVQNEIRYLSMSLGENSHKPFPPDVVLARRYGDCKDKALLLVTMLRRLGIEAAPVLVSATSPKALDRFLPTPLVFDHAIVRAVVDGKVYFIDPTRSAQYGPLAAMGQAHNAAQALVIAPDSAKLVAIPGGTQAALPSNIRTEHLVVRKIDEAADLTVWHRYNGLQAEAARYYIGRGSKEQLRKFYVASVLRRYPNAELLSGPIVSDNRKNNTVAIEMHYRVPAALEKNSEGWQLRYQASNLTERFYLPENPRRNAPLAVPLDPVASRYELELTLPDDFNADYKPSTVTVRNAGFRADETLDFKGHIAHASVDLTILADRVPPQDVPGFMADIRKFGNMIDASMQIRRSDLKQGGVSAIVDAPLKQRLAEQLTATINTNTTAINEARAAGSPVADALCERGLSYARLGKRQEAAADVQAALAEGKPSRELLRCKAQIAYFSGDMKTSEADFARAAAQGDNDAGATFLHAMSSYALGKWRDAADQFAQASERFGDAQDKARADIMRMLCQRRLNQRPRAAAPVDDGADWRATAQAAIDGSKNDDDVLREVHRQTDDKLEYALAEAYYYLGQINLLGGNKIKAMVYLQRSADKGIVVSDYHSAARLEAEHLRR